MRTLLTAVMSLSLLALAGCKSANPQSPEPQHATHADKQMHHEHGKMHHEHGKSCTCHKKHQEAEAPDQADVSAEAATAFEAPPAVGTRATCPVTGETFTVTEDTARSEQGGKHYAFCCPGCKGKFDASPEQFTTK